MIKNIIESILDYTCILIFGLIPVFYFVPRYDFIQSVLDFFPWDIFQIHTHGITLTQNEFMILFALSVFPFISYKLIFRSMLITMILILFTIGYYFMMVTSLEEYLYTIVHEFFLIAFYSAFKIYSSIPSKKFQF